MEDEGGVSTVIKQERTQVSSRGGTLNMTQSKPRISETLFNNKSVYVEFHHAPAGYQQSRKFMCLTVRLGDVIPNDKDRLVRSFPSVV